MYFVLVKQLIQTTVDALHRLWGFNNSPLSISRLEGRLTSQQNLGFYVYFCVIQHCQWFV